MYQSLGSWPLTDVVAQYGHVVNNGIVILMAIRYHVTFYMGFNLICVCLYYTIATVRLSRRAHYNYQLSGLQSQTDLRLAKMITKSYKVGSFYEFLAIRKVIWRIQFGALLLAGAIGALSPLLAKGRDKLKFAE